MNAVTFIEENIFHTYRFSTISKYGCSSKYAKCLEYAYKQICSIITNNPF